MDWAHFDVELHKKDLKTTLINGFDYYVSVDEITQYNIGEFEWRCTLTQVHDNEVLKNQMFYYPPVQKSQPTKKEKENFYFWQNLKQRKNTNKSTCQAESDQAIQDIKNEIQVLTTAKKMMSESKSRASKKDDFNNLKENDEFTSEIICTPYLVNQDTYIKLSCFSEELPKLDSIKRTVRGKILKIDKRTQIVTLTLNEEDNEEDNTILYNGSAGIAIFFDDKFKVHYNKNAFFWKRFKKLDRWEGGQRTTRRLRRRQRRQTQFNTSQ
jgi:hypothetical protein